MRKHALPFVLAASDHGPMIVARTDFAVSPNGMYGVGLQILATGSYDADEIAFVKKVLDDIHSARDGTIFALDCGANIGVHAVEMSRHMLGWGGVVAVEPQRALFYALCGNLVLNNFHHTGALNVAIGAETGMMKMPVPDYNKPGSFGSLGFQFTDNVEFIGQAISYDDVDMVDIQVATVDSIVGSNRLDFLKLDVEGMELDALKGAKATIERDRPVMLIEWIKTGKEPLVAFLSEFDYAVDDVGMNILALPA